MNREKELPQRKLTRLKNADYNRNGAVFLTVCTKDRRCILSRIVGTGVPDGPKVELTPYGKVADKYIRQLNDFYEEISVESYVIMPNHIHIMLWVKGENGPSRTPENGPSGTPVPTVQNSIPSRFVSTFKRFCNKEYGENIWQYRSNDHIIRNRQDYEEHLRYIYENPIRWQYDELYIDP
jgi:REP element-mobilizing transposase RayT